MTRTSNYKFAALAGGLLSLAAAGTGVAQQSAAGERYARALAETDITARYNVQIEQQLRSQQQEITALEEQIAGLDATAVDVESMLQRMFDEFVQFVQNDVPFFKEERDRANSAAHGSHAERRRNDFGEIPSPHRGLSDRDGVWADDELVPPNIGGRPRRGDGALGRVALMYRSDRRRQRAARRAIGIKSRSGLFPDPDSAVAIEEALSIAKEEKAPDLIVVPVPAAQGGRS